MKKAANWITGLVALVLMFVIVGLTMAHVAVVREMAVLPGVGLLQATNYGNEYPVRISYINTASQEMPRAGVLDSAQDPTPNARYVMSHPAFVLEWADGKILLVDAGMTREGAESFGGILEWASGAQPMQALGPVAEQLGIKREQVRGIVFTHLHTDHVGGIEGLCAGRNDKISVLMTEAQAERPNYTTRPGLKMVRGSPCLQEARLKDGPILRSEMFPGIAVLAAGGHTPGSQIVIARVGSLWAPKTYVFTGDIVNNIDGVNHNVPKPYLYSLLVVPEARGRLFELRQYLRRLRDEGHFQLLVAHDQLQIEASAVPRFNRN